MGSECTVNPTKELRISSRGTAIHLRGRGCAGRRTRHRRRRWARHRREAAAPRRAAATAWRSRPTQRPSPRARPRSRSTRLTLTLQSANTTFYYFNACSTNLLGRYTQITTNRLVSKKNIIISTHWIRIFLLEYWTKKYEEVPRDVIDCTTFLRTLKSRSPTTAIWRISIFVWFTNERIRVQYGNLTGGFFTMWFFLPSQLPYSKLKSGFRVLALT